MASDKKTSGITEAVSTLVSSLAVLVIVVLIARPASAEEPPAFVLSGKVDSVFAGKHQNGGLFSVRACGRKALIEVVYENGYSEVVGTDGEDSFLYCPFSGPAAITNRASAATITRGRFPSSAHPFAQILWLFCTHDEGFRSDLAKNQFYFYGDYTPGEIKPVEELRDSPPKLLRSIRWYAPGKLASGTNRYELTLYPQGWLVADASVSETKAVEGLTLPAVITLTQHATQSVTNASQLAAIRGRSPNDVNPVGRVVFAVTNASIGRPLHTYVPEIIDTSTRVHDKRINLVATVKSGKWWLVGQLSAEFDARNRQRRWVVIISLLLLSIALVLIMVRVGIRRSKTTS